MSPGGGEAADGAQVPGCEGRLCFTVWIDSLTPSESILTRDHLQFTSWYQAENFFQKSSLQRCISRAVYAEEYEETLVRCVQGTVAEAPMLAQHHAHVKTLVAQLKPIIDEFRRRKVDIEKVVEVDVDEVVVEKKE